MAIQKNKKAIEMGFNWIFAILAGSFILFLAIYSTSKFIGVQEKALYTESAARVVSLLDPFETGLASGKSSEINFKKETRIYMDLCSSKENEPFGKQGISFSEKTFEEFGDKSERVAIKNKYVFMDRIAEGKKMYIFSKPFFMPFKVADLIIIISKNYCFYDSPIEIQNELENLNIKNVYFPNSTEKCEGIKVCFEDSDKCDVKIDMNEKYAQKNNKKTFFYDSLVYGAIFSSPDVYECNVKRLMNKINELGYVYIDKIKIIERKECRPRVESKLLSLMNSAEELKDSGQLIKLGELSDEIISINDAANPGCMLFS